MNKYAVCVAPNEYVHIEADKYRVMDGYLFFRVNVPGTDLSKEIAVFAAGKWVCVIDYGPVESKDDGPQ